MKKLRIRHPVLLGAFYYVLLGFDFTGIFRIGLLAAVLHEFGHVAVWLLLKRNFPALELHFGGLQLCRTAGILSAPNELLLALAGPGANFAAAVCALAVMQRHAGYYGYQFACANLLLACFNLLPVGCLDGRYLWDFLREKLQSRAG